MYRDKFLIKTVYIVVSEGRGPERETRTSVSYVSSSVTRMGRIFVPVRVGWGCDSIYLYYMPQLLVDGLVGVVM